MVPHSPESTRSDPLFPYTTLFRSAPEVLALAPEPRLGPGCQLLLTPRLVEEGDLHPPAAVGHERLDHHSATTASPAERARRDPIDPGQHRRQVADVADGRSQERRIETEGVSTSRSWWARSNDNNTQQRHQN